MGATATATAIKKQSPAVARRQGKPLFWTGFYAITIFYVLFSLAPILYMVLTSFKERADVYAMPPKLIFKPSLQAYEHVFANADMVGYFMNTVITAVASAGLSLVFGTMAAYALARLPVPKREDFAFYILSIRMFPAVAAAIPIFLIYKTFNMLDTRPGLILAHITFNLPFVVWMLRGFIEAIPKELEEAAMIDGRSRIRAFLDVTMPLLMPSLAAVAIFCIIFSWNEFLFGLILTSRHAKTMPVSITEFITWREVTWDAVAAAATILILPVIIFTFLVQKYLVRGLTMGAVRG